MKERYCINCEKETPDTPCPYCGGRVFKNHKCDGGDDDGLVSCRGCEKEMLSHLNPALKCIRCNDNGCPACDGTKGSKYNPEPF